MNKKKYINFNYIFNIKTTFSNDTKTFFSDYPFLLIPIGMNYKKNKNIDILKIVNQRKNTLDVISKEYRISNSVLKKFKKAPINLENFTPEILFPIIREINIHIIPAYTDSPEDFNSFISIIKYLIGFYYLVIDSNVYSKEGNILIANWINNKSKYTKWGNLKNKIESLFPKCQLFDPLNISFEEGVIIPWTKDLIYYLILSVIPIWSNYLDIININNFTVSDLFLLINEKYVDIAENLLIDLSPESIFKIGYRFFNFMNAKKPLFINNNLYALLDSNLVVPKFVYKDYEFKQITNGKDLIINAIDMNNCSYLYHLRSMFDNRIIVCLKKKNKNLVTLEIGLEYINNKNKKLFIIQKKIKNNLEIKSNSSLNNIIVIYKDYLNSLNEIDLGNSKNVFSIKKLEKSFNAYNFSTSLILHDIHDKNSIEYIRNLMKSLKICANIDSKLNVLSKILFDIN